MKMELKASKESKETKGLKENKDQFCLKDLILLFDDFRTWLSS